MKKKNCALNRALSPAHLIGFGAYQTAFFLMFFDARLIVIPLGLFVILCMIAPFLPGLSFFLGIISRGNSGEKAVALTFDDGPDPIITPALLRLLSKYDTPATFFVVGQKVIQYPEIIQEIIKQGHAVGNHSHTHDNFMMLKRIDILTKEIETAQKVLKDIGIVSFAFRPPVGITNPRLQQVLLRLGLYCVNFSCRAKDRGNRRIENLSVKILKCIRSDDIILLHDICPKKKSQVSYWLKEIESLILGIKAKGFRILPLSEMIGCPVMEISKKK